jgi:benzylsuccinate CoA-transferase BbsF subunit
MDHSTGNNVAYALLLALYRRKRTGKGMRIDLSMQETGVSCIGPAMLEAQRGITRPRLGCGHLWKAPHNVYPCAGTDRWIAITVSDDSEWGALKHAMGAPAWAHDARYDSVQTRWENRHQLDRRIAEWTAGQDDKVLAKLLQTHQVCAGAVLTAADLTDDPHLKHRGFLQKIERAGGTRTIAGRPFRIPGIPMAIRHVADLGEHNEAVLTEVAGLSRDEIGALAKDGVISNRPRPEKRAP